MALDPHGFGIPIPDEDTQPYELQAIVAAGFEILTRRLAGIPGVTAPMPPDYGARVAALETRVDDIAALADRPNPPDYGRDVEQLRRDLADLKLSNLGRMAG